jgi:carotenoid cleavage dioxygenase-like enzyme
MPDGAAHLSAGEPRATSAEPWSKQNPFLQGPFEPLFNEVSIRSLEVIGRIPMELDGALYRTGSNQHMRPANPDLFHWFDGDGMVHAFHLRDGKAGYCNRFVETDGLKLERAAGRPIYNGIYGHSDVRQAPLPPGAPRIKTVAGINVISLAGRVMTMHEADSFYWHLDADSLDTLGKFDFGGRFKSMLTAHPHVDPATGDLLVYGLNYDEMYVECMSIGNMGQVNSHVRTSMPITPFVHDFIFTENYYVFFFGPIRWRPYAADTVVAGNSAFSFDRGSPTRILLLHRKTGVAKWLEARSFTCDHYLNAYELGDKIIVDATVTETLDPNADIRPEEFFPFPLVDKPSPFSGPQLWRIEIDLARETVSDRRIGEFAAEFVRPNESVMGRPHRYGYMAGVHNPGPQTRGFNCLIKHDYLSGRTQYQHLSSEIEMTPGEPVFVPRDGGEGEDDGWIMAIWYDPRRNASEMTILAAQDFDGEPVARIKLDHRVPLGFHGNWIARASLR